IFYRFFFLKKNYFEILYLYRLTNYLVTDGIQKVFDIASRSQNLCSQEVYVHCKELGEQVKFIKNKKKFYNENVEDN
ncbi:1572_t:CDS:1, partial [Gigaspora margarita]